MKKWISFTLTGRGRVERCQKCLWRHQQWAKRRAPCAPWKVWWDIFLLLHRKCEYTHFSPQVFYCFIFLFFSFFSRIGCYVSVFSSVSNLRDIFYKEMSTVGFALCWLSSFIQLAHIIQFLKVGFFVLFFFLLPFLAQCQSAKCDEGAAGPASRQSVFSQGTATV